MRCRCKGSGHSALHVLSLPLLAKIASFCGFFTRNDLPAQCTPISAPILTTELHFSYCSREKPTGNSVTSVTTQAEMSHMSPQPCGLVSLSHTHVFAVILHSTKLLHQLFELLAVSATEHHLGASCMESFGTFCGGSKEERKVGM